MSGKSCGSCGQCKSKCSSNQNRNQESSIDKSDWTQIDMFKNLDEKHIKYPRDIDDTDASDMSHLDDDGDWDVD